MKDEMLKQLELIRWDPRRKNTRRNDICFPSGITMHVGFGRLWQDFELSRATRSVTWATIVDLLIILGSVQVSSIFYHRASSWQLDIKGILPIRKFFFKPASQAQSVKKFMKICLSFILHWIDVSPRMLIDTLWTQITAFAVVTVVVTFAPACNMNNSRRWPLENQASFLAVHLLATQVCCVVHEIQLLQVADWMWMQRTFGIVNTNMQRMMITAASQGCAWWWGHSPMMTTC